MAPGWITGRILWALFTAVTAQSEALPGGVAGAVYVQGDSMSAPWLPLSGAAVIVDAAPRDTSVALDTGLLTVGERGLSPLMQALNPGGILRVVSRSSSLHRLQARSDAGDLVFSLALTIPGLEIDKTVRDRGLLTITCAEQGHDHEIAYVIVRPHVGWAATDEQGRFLISGVPTGVRAIRVLYPDIGSSVDSVDVIPARAAERDFYLIRPDLPPLLPSPERE